MEIIRKTICLEKSKSRVNSGLPYIECNGSGEILTCDTVTIVNREHDVIVEKEYHTNNFGNFQCDIDSTNQLFNDIISATTTLQVTGEDYIRTTNLIKRYNELLETLRTSLHLKHVKNEGCEDTGTHSDTYLSDFKYSGVSGDTTYGFLREAEVVPMFDEEGNENFVNLGNGLYEGYYENDYDYVIVINNYDSFQKDGGKRLILLVDSLLVNPDTGTSISNTDGFIAPYVSIPLLLTQNKDSLGVMTPYVNEYNEFIYSGTVSYDVAMKYNHDIDNNASIYDNVDECVSDCSKEERCWVLQPTSIEELSGIIEDITVESRLTSLRVQKYFKSDDDELLPGLFVDFPHNGVGPFFLCTYHTSVDNREHPENRIKGKHYYTKVDISEETYEKGDLVKSEVIKPYEGEVYYAIIEYVPYGDEQLGDEHLETIDGIEYVVVDFEQDFQWWKIENVEETEWNNLKCADGESIQWGSNDKYQTLTVFNSLLYYTVNSYGLPDGSSYHFLVKYDNSENSPMVVPYIVGEVVNKSFNEFDSAYTGDYVISMEENDDEITFEYVVGAHFDSGYTTPVSDTGIYYKETYPYYTSISATTTLDKVKDTIYWYNEIDFNSESKVVYSEDLNLTRTAVTTTVGSIQLGDVWKCDDGSVINTPLIKEEYLMSVSMDAVTDIDVAIDRGNATAFERHLILSECNTFEDIENYRNNFYNL